MSRLSIILAICAAALCYNGPIISSGNDEVELCQNSDLTNVDTSELSCENKLCPTPNDNNETIQPQFTLDHDQVHNSSPRVAKHQFHERIEELNEQITSSFNGRVPEFLSEWLRKDTDYFEKTDVVRTYLYNLEKFHQKNSIAQIGLAGLYVQIHSSEYSFMYMHRYESYHDLKQAAGPQVDQETCIRQMTDLKQRIQVATEQRYDSKDVQLHQLMDTYGRNPAGLLQGNLFWEGLYSECNRLKLSYSYENWFKLHDTRYCVVKFRASTWPDHVDNEIVALRFGACLPRACDSLNYKNKHDLLIDLYNFNARSIDVGAAKVIGLYCLPDEQSPMRSIWSSKSSALTLVLGACWIGLLVYATIRHRRSQNAGHPSESADRMMEVYKSLSITNNLTLLFDTAATSSLVQAGNQLKDTVMAKRRRESDGTAATNQVKFTSARHDEESVVKVIDLRVIEALKTIAMSYVIFAHTLMCSTSGMLDGRQITNNPLFFFGNMIPAFSVNTFFGITGLLTCYLMFKQNDAYPFMTQPTKWIAFIIYRYLRIMPVYLIAVLYSKNIAKYTNYGPIWDYGTSSLSQRRICEEESWLWTLLFGANFKKPLEHCIPGAWYLANDMQFFLVTPIFLIFLHRSPKWGKRFLGLCIVGLYVASMVNIFQSDVDDFIPIALFNPHGFKTYVTNLHYNYTRPYYRIPAYLFGLYIGYVLYNFEKDKLRYFELKKRKEQASTDQQLVEDDVGEEPDFPEAFKTYCTPVSVVLVFLCCMTPIIASYLPFNKMGARIMVSFICPSYHLAFSIVICLYIMASSTTKQRNVVTKLLSLPQWKPLSRLSLCVLLINVEVVIYIIQGRKALHALSMHYMLSITILILMGSYLAGTILCILFEAPLRAALNHVLRYALFKMRQSLKESRKASVSSISSEADSGYKESVVEE